MRFYTTTTARTKSILLIPLSYVYCLWLMSCHCCLMANGEFYSSVDSLKALGNMEATLLRNYRQYLKNQRQEIHRVQRFIENIKYHQTLAAEDIEDYLGNPINAFILIKRMVNDWSDVNEFLKLDGVRNDLLESLTQFEKLFEMPNEKELKGAILGLGRLQAIYKLNAEDMANGKKYGSPLTWRDCFEIGTTFSDEKNYKLATTWLELSLDKLEESQETNEIKSTFSIHIKEYLAWTLQKVGETEMALEYLDDFETEDSQHYAKLTKKILMNHKNYDNGELNAATWSNDESTDYARLCRGEEDLQQKKRSNLQCRLDSKINTYFTLAPLQIEPVHENPNITIYHNLLNENQISQLIIETEDKMERSRVMLTSDDDIVEETRVSQQMWLKSKESSIAKMMYNLIAAISGFDMENTEEMQVANYGIGGQYEPHHDYLFPEFEGGDLKGDRISTNMFYLSNVEEGGYTVFPNLQLYLKPVKGSMVMWYNLHKSGESDNRTLHGGCPVLKGSKKIANVWTHSDYQELRRPCDLNPSL